MASVKIKVVTQEYIEGEFKMVEIENFDASLKISWVKKNVSDHRPPKVAEDSGWNHRHWQNI